MDNTSKTGGWGKDNINELGVVLCVRCHLFHSMVLGYLKYWSGNNNSSSKRTRTRYSRSTKNKTKIDDNDDNDDDNDNDNDNDVDNILVSASPPS